VTTPQFPEGLESLVGPYLERQDWYRDSLAGGSLPAEVSIGSAEVLAGSWLGAAEPGLGRLVIGADGERFQLVVGWRSCDAAAEALGSSDFAILGSLHGDEGEVMIFDALADEELLLDLLRVASGGISAARRARVVESLTSHSSVIYDDKLFMKLYRVLVPSPRREVELMLRLDDAGFNHIVAPVAVWTDDGFDLAVVREFVSGGLEGRSLAITSLRDLLGAAAEADSDPGRERATPDELARWAGGDFAGEARRLGAMTGHMHIALASAFGMSDADADALGESIAAAGDLEMAAQVKAMHDIGKAIRIQGDYQLRRVMRTDAGWIVVGFGDDPSPIARLDASQPLMREGVAAEDIADMCHSLSHVAESVVAEYGEDTAPTVQAALVAPTPAGPAALVASAASASEQTGRRALADAWVRRNTSAFVDGYLATPGIRNLLPRHPAAFHLLLDALENVRSSRDQKLTE
jgi:predicted trehalose synthase